MYRDGFEKWSDVTDNFACKEAEPEQVIYAEYDLSRAYEGSAYVLYRNGDKFYEVEGSHCSCYGLEGQWEPIVSDYETMIAVLKKRAENTYYRERAELLLSLISGAPVKAPSHEE